MAPKGRFAPSPSGRMHLGNVYAALMSWLSARKSGGTWLLRMEDLDRQRCRSDYAALIMDDLHWLGLDWDEGPRSPGDTQFFQSSRDSFYKKAFDTLCEKGLVYDCFCTRADLLASSAPHAGPSVYPGKCRTLTRGEREALSRTRRGAQRVAVGQGTISFSDGHYGAQRYDLATGCGDFVVRRADGNFAYQLAVVIDDALMGVTEVVRGRDLLPSTPQQLFLYQTLGLTPPRFSHIPLMTAADGRRLSKRDGDMGMDRIRATLSPLQVTGRIMHLCGFTEADMPLTLQQALDLFDWEKLPQDDISAGLCRQP